MLEGEEEFVEEPEGVDPPGVAYPEDGARDGPWEDDELEEEVDAGFPGGHVDELEVSQVRLPPSEHLSPEESSRLHQPSVRAYPEIPNALQQSDIVPWGVFDVWLGAWDQGHDSCNEWRFERDLEAEDRGDQLIREELTQPDGPLQRVVVVKVVEEGFDALGLHVTLEPACISDWIPVVLPLS